MEVKIAKESHGTALGLVFLSGFAALIYQVLWMKQIGLLFGNTSHAASATLTSFFAGLAVGSWVLGRRVSTSQNPMRTYAWLEAGIAITALLYFAILAIYQHIYPSIYQLTHSSGWLLIIKFGLSLLLVFPPAFCMGGTIPVIGQSAIRKRESFGAISALMYGINTLGAAIGATLAGFYLPLWLGFNATCAVAILTSAAIGIMAWRLSCRSTSGFTNPQPSEHQLSTPEEPALTRQERRLMARNAKRGKTPEKTRPTPEPSPAFIPNRAITLGLCFVSGFSVLGLEILWTRMFSQVLENSVYTFSAILWVVLICLSAGALISSRLTRLNRSPFIILTILLLAGAAAITATPWIFMKITDGMQIIASRGNWSSYILLIIGVATATIAPSCILLGTVFPYLMKVEERHLKSPGLSLGQLATANTIGAILGSLLCGFLLLDWLDMWRTMQVIALIYITAGLILPLGLNAKSIAAKIACFAVLIGVIAIDPRSLPIVSTDPDALPEKVIETWEGSDCTVSVTDSENGIAIRINSHYSLGSTGSYMQERFQADLPLLIKPDAENLFFLGVGTGISAGSALGPQHAHVKKVVACELVPEVITAAKKYFTDVAGFDPTGGLFHDSRATVLIEDGRHYLMATDEKFDIINSDLFVPFRSGAGSLYTKEHFISCKNRLRTHGIMVQWLPLYQLTENEFSIITKTMVDVFGQVSMWRHNFQPGSEIVALIGHEGGSPLPASRIDSHEDQVYAVHDKTYHDIQNLSLPLDPQTVTLFYCGNVSASRALFDHYPVNTDNHPIIEYMAPRTYRNLGSSSTPWFVGQPFASIVDKIQALCPPDQDPLLIHRSPQNRRLPLAGIALQHARNHEIDRDEQATHDAWLKFVSEWTHP